MWRLGRRVEGCAIKATKKRTAGHEQGGQHPILLYSGGLGGVAYYSFPSSDIPRLELRCGGPVFPIRPFTGIEASPHLYRICASTIDGGARASNATGRRRQSLHRKQDERLEKVRSYPHGGSFHVGGHGPNPEEHRSDQVETGDIPLSSTSYGTAEHMLPVISKILSTSRRPATPQHRSRAAHLPCLAGRHGGEGVMEFARSPCDCS